MLGCPSPEKGTMLVIKILSGGGGGQKHFSAWQFLSKLLEAVGYRDKLHKPRACVLVGSLLWWHK